MWKQAVEKAKAAPMSTRSSRRWRTDLQGAVGLHHQDGREEPPPAQAGVHRRGAKADGQFNVVWKTKGPVKAQPWSPFIEGNDKKKDTPEGK
jgi:urea transport system substrate-binding protein